MLLLASASSEVPTTPRFGLTDAQLLQTSFEQELTHIPQNVCRTPSSTSALGPPEKTKTSCWLASQNPLEKQQEPSLGTPRFQSVGRAAKGPAAAIRSR